MIKDRTRHSGLTGRRDVAHGSALGRLPAARREEVLAQFAEHPDRGRAVVEDGALTL